MKTLKFFLLACVFFSFSGCKNELFDVKFGLNTKAFIFNLEPTSAAGEIILGPQAQTVNLDSLAKAFGTDLSKVKSVTITKIKAFIISPPTSNFDILDSGVLYLTTGVIGNPDFDELKIAEFTQVPKSLNELDINPSTADVLSFAKKPNLTVSGKLKTNAPLLTATTLKLVVDFEVVANPVQ